MNIELILKQYSGGDPVKHAELWSLVDFGRAWGHQEATDACRQGAAHDLMQEPVYRTCGCGACRSCHFFMILERRGIDVQ